VKETLANNNIKEQETYKWSRKLNRLGSVLCVLCAVTDCVCGAGGGGIVTVGGGAVGRCHPLWGGGGV
jgi:hypothetical protein